MSVTYIRNGVTVLYDPMGHAKVTVSTTAVALPSLPTRIDAVRRVMIRPLDADILYRDDGTDPTSTTGFPILKDEVFVYDGNFAAFKMIRKGGTDADVRVAYYGDA